MNLHELSVTRLDAGVVTPHSARLFSSERVAHLYLGTYVLLLVMGILSILYAQTASTFPFLRPEMGAPIVRARQLHSAIMTYLCMIPGIPAALGGVLLPKVLGKEPSASVRFALASLFVYWSAAVVIIVSVLKGGCESGILYPTTYPSSVPGPLLGVAVGVLLVGLSCSLNGIFAIKSTVNCLLDRPRSRWLPPVASTVCVNGVMHVLLLPVQCLTVTLMFQRRFGIHSFIDLSNGSDPMLLRQLSWFYLHPLMLVALFPVFGLIDYAIESSSTKSNSEPVSSNAVLLHSMIAAAVLGCFTWGIHLLQAGLGPWLSTMTSALSLLMIVPFGLSFAHIHAKLCAVRKATSAPVLFASSALLMLGLGMCAALPQAILGVNSALQGTEFMIGQYHFISSAVCILGVLAGVSVVWEGAQPQRSRAFMAEKIGIVATLALVVAFGAQLVAGINEAQHRTLGDITHGKWSVLVEFGSLVAGVSLIALATTYLLAKWVPRFHGHDLSRNSNQ